MKNYCTTSCTFFWSPRTFELFAEKTTRRKKKSCKQIAPLYSNQMPNSTNRKKYTKFQSIDRHHGQLSRDFSSFHKIQANNYSHSSTWHFYTSYQGHWSEQMLHNWYYLGQRIALIQNDFAKFRVLFSSFFKSTEALNTCSLIPLKHKFIVFSSFISHSLFSGAFERRFNQHLFNHNYAKLITSIGYDILNVQTHVERIFRRTLKIVRVVGISGENCLNWKLTQFFNH